MFAKAKWIWDKSSPCGYNEYRRFKTSFNITSGEFGEINSRGSLTLLISADALYQAWLNGKIIGHGPAKSAAGRRSVDTYEIGHLACAGNNTLEILVLSIGCGIMTYCLGDAGLIFELCQGKKILCSSGGQTLVRVENERNKFAVRRWILPCIEDVNAAGNPVKFAKAKVVSRKQELYPRRVPLPSRMSVSPEKIVHAERVRFPNFSVSFRLKQYLVSEKEKILHNPFNTPAWIVTDIVSSTDQEIRFTPSMGSVAWYFEGRKLFTGSGWIQWDPLKSNPVIRLKKGSNRLIGMHVTDHFEDINLSGFSERVLKFKNPFGEGAFQVIPMDEINAPKEEDVTKLDFDSLRSRMCRMDEKHTMVCGNFQDLVYGAETYHLDEKSYANATSAPLSSPIELPASKGDKDFRIILDLGSVHLGWFAFEVEGAENSELIFSFFEGLDYGPPLRFQWAPGCNNAVRYRLKGGMQDFESFLPYGIRYIAVHYSGKKPARISNIRILSANCGSRRNGTFVSSDSELNKIFEICAQTLISGVDDTYTDCPTFEQVNWNCDNYLSAMADFYITANTEIIRNSILLFAEDREYPGLVRSQYPSAWNNQIPLWSFFWILWCRHYYLMTGDAGFLKKVFPQIRNGIGEALKKIGKNGLMSWGDSWHLVEWAHGRDDDQAINTAEQSGLAAVLVAGAEIAVILGGENAQFANLWKSARQSLVQAINRELWDEKRRAYADSLHDDGTLSPVSSLLTNSAMVYFDVVPESRHDLLFGKILSSDKSLLPVGSPFGLIYVLEALDKEEKVEELFALIRKRWGEMAASGDNTGW